MGMGTSPRPGRTINPVAVLITLLAVALVALVVVGAMLLARHSDRSAASGSDAGHGSTSEQWVGSVCQVGTYQNGKGGALSGADGGSASCTGKSSSGNGFGGYIMIGTYSSQFRLQNAVAVMLRGSVYATLTDNAGQFWLFYAMNGVADLSPLSQFGFTLHTV